MSELETKAQAEVEEFTDELSDEALDREQSEGGRGQAFSFCYGS